MPAYRDSTGRWRYRFAFEGRRYSGSAPKGANTARCARDLERAHIDKLQARVFTGVMPTVAQFAPRFLEYQRGHTKSLTYELNETIIELHVVPHIGKVLLDRVDAAYIDQLKATWDCAPRTKNTRIGVILRMLALAVEWGFLVRVPKVKPVKVPKETPRFLSEPEAAALIEKAPVNWVSMVIVGLRTGMRIGELRGLQWGDIDFDRRLVHVRRTDPGRPDMDSNAPKGNRPRVIPLTPDAIQALLAQRGRVARHAPRDWVFPGAESWRAERNRVRTRSEGNCAEMMGRMAKAAKLGDEVTWHTLRHTFASWLVMRGVPMRAVQDLLGHASMKMTEIYAHLAPGFVDGRMVASLDLPLLPVPALTAPKEDE